MTTNGFVGHLLDCRSALARMEYDPRCVRCSQIKKVIHLRRKTTGAGCLEGEVDAAQAISDALVAKYNLTRGEVYDRAYAPPPTKQVYEENVVWATRKKRHEPINPEDVG